MKTETENRTALEWLECEFVKLESTVGVHSSMYHLIEKAMLMEKEQMVDFAYKYGNLTLRQIADAFDNEYKK
jgi:hypothetical protein